MARRISEGVINRIKLLRAKGWTIPEIYKQTRVGYGTVWRYAHNTNIKPQFQNLWLSKRKSSIQRKLLAEKRAKTNAKRVIRSITDKEKLIAISTLYWAEGNKGFFSFTNTDPKMIRLFVSCLKDVLNIPNNRIRFSVRVFEDMNPTDCINFWLQTTGLPRDCFHSINVQKGQKAGKLQYGMCRLRLLKGGDVLKYIKAINQEISDKICPCSSTDRTEVS